MRPLLPLPEFQFYLEVEDKHETHVRNDFSRDEGSKEKQEGKVLIGRGMWWLRKPLSWDRTSKSQSKSVGAVCEISLGVCLPAVCFRKTKASGVEGRERGGSKREMPMPGSRRQEKESLGVQESS